MKKWPYLAYVIVVVLITLIAGAEDPDARQWSSSSNGRSGWSSGGGHK